VPTFSLGKFIYNVCLTISYGPERSMFEWGYCRTRNDQVKQWVTFRSNERPGMIQICYAHGQKKCLIASNQTNAGLANSVMLANYQSTAKVNLAQLWKWNSQSRHLMNAEYSSCLADITNRENKIVLLHTTQCEDNETSPMSKQWDFTPIVDDNRMCADFQISQ